MNDQQTTERLVRIETNIERMMASLETIAKDHEVRLRALETELQRWIGVLKVVAWLGAPSMGAVIVFLATRH